MIVFTTHVLLEAEACSIALPPEIEADITNPVVVPTSTVVNSLKRSVPPNQKALNIPALPFEALVTLYSTCILL